MMWRVKEKHAFFTIVDVQLFGEATAFETSKYEVTDFPPKQGKKVRPMR
jgi:exonuclease VII large subunit